MKIVIVREVNDEFAYKVKMNKVKVTYHVDCDRATYVANSLFDLFPITIREETSLIPIQEVK